MNRYAHRATGLAIKTISGLVVQSQQDPVVDPKGSKKAFEKIGSNDKQYVVFNFKRHGIMRGKGSDRVHRVLGEFVRYIGQNKQCPSKNEGFRSRSRRARNFTTGI